MSYDETEELDLPSHLTCLDCGSPCGGAYDARCVYCAAALEDRERSASAKRCRGCDGGTGPLCTPCRILQEEQAHAVACPGCEGGPALNPLCDSCDYEFRCAYEEVSR